MFIPYKKSRDYRVPVIVEFGQQNIRAGYAGADGPSLVMPSDYLMDSEGSMKFIENNSTIMPANYEVKNLIQNGQILDFDVWKEFLDHIINTQFRYEKGFPFFMIEGSHIKKEVRCKMIEILFEDIEVSSVFFHRNTLLAQYTMGRDTILAVDCGAYNTTVTPIIDGSIIEKAIIRGDIGGENITQKLYQNWKRQNLKFSRYLNYNELTPSVQQFGDLEVVREIKHAYCKFYDQPIENLKFNPTVDNQIHDLPDNQKLEISIESYTYPELLFQQSETCDGFDRMIEQSLEKIDQDYRKELVQNVTLIGGSTCTTNFLERMQRTINQVKLVGISSRCKVQTLPRPFDRQHSTWIGGSVVASSPIYDQWTLAKQDYEEHGPTLIEKKMFY